MENEQETLLNLYIAVNSLCWNVLVEHWFNSTLAGISDCVNIDKNHKSTSIIQFYWFMANK